MTSHPTTEPSPQQIDQLNALFRAGRAAELEQASRLIIASYPQFGFAWKALGAALQLQGKNALEAQRKAVELLPGDVSAINNLGTGLLDAGHTQESIALFRRALEIDPTFAQAHCNLGAAFASLDDADEALLHYRRALQLNPRFPEAHNNIGELLKATRQFEAAEASYRQAIAIHPDYADAHCNLACFLLSLGRYQEAWGHNTYRFHPQRGKEQVRLPAMPMSGWNGEPLQSKSIVVCHEQGMGDTIQFVRYAALLKQMGASRVAIYCPRALQRLLETFEGVDKITAMLPSAGEYDYWIPALDVPRLVNTMPETLPAHIPYLHALPALQEKWRTRLPANGYKVGLVWHGNPLLSNDRNRSLPALATLAPLWRVPGVTFVSLQKSHGPAEAPHAAQTMVELADQFEDFADTAAVIAQLDLVISVDTSVAHLAGALGKRCWVMLPIEGLDWRWQLDRDDSPWYPQGMRLFRQTKKGDWSDMVENIATALASEIVTPNKS